MPCGIRYITLYSSILLIHNTKKHKHKRERSMKDITTPHKESGEGCGKRANGRAFLPIK